MQYIYLGHQRGTKSYCHPVIFRYSPACHLNSVQLSGITDFPGNLDKEPTLLNCIQYKLQVPQ